MLNRIFKFVPVLLCLGLAPALLAQSGLNIINQNWDDSVPAPYLSSYAGGNATAAKSIQAGVGTSGSKALVLDANFVTGNCLAGVQYGTASNPNTTLTDPNLVSISFDLRVTTPATALRTIDFYVQSWPGVYGAPRDGTWSARFTPTADYQTYTFTLGSLNHDSGNVIPNHQTLQLSWQIGTQYDGWSLGQHTVQIDNIRVSTVPSPSSFLTALIGIVPGVMLLRRRK